MLKNNDKQHLNGIHLILANIAVGYDAHGR